MKVNVSVEVDQAIASLRAIRRDQIPYAVSLALNDVGRLIREQTPALLRRDLDKPTPFTTDPRGMFQTYAKKATLETTVGFRPLQSAYLRYQIEGGLRQPKRKALRLPSEIPLDQYGNLPARTIATLVARAKAQRRLTKKQSARLRISRKVDIFYGDPGDSRPPGLYQRVPVPGPGDNRLIPLVVFPARAARYKPRMDWYGEAERTARRAIEGAFDAAMRKAMATAR